MTYSIGKAWVLLAALILSACSMQGMIDRMVSDEDRAFTQQFVSDIRSGDLAGLEAAIDPEIWAESEPQLAAAAGEFPDNAGDTRIIAYSFEAESFDDDARTTKEFTLLTTDNERWTTTRITTLQRGDEPVVTGWRVEGADGPPADLAGLEQMDRIFFWVGIVLLIVLIGLVGIIVWLVRRVRRKRQRFADTNPV